MNIVKSLAALPFIERTRPGCAPMMSITAPRIRDDGNRSYRECNAHSPLKLYFENKIKKDFRMEKTDDFPDVTDPNEQEIG